LAAWRTDVAEFIYVTAPATARASGVATEDFIRKLGALEGPELFLLAEEIDRVRQGRAKF
jgi:hypothetical protein